MPSVSPPPPPRGGRLVVDAIVYNLPFEPTEVDVVSSRLRSWNQSHPGNMYYTSTIQQYAKELLSSGTPLSLSVLKHIAKNIHGHLTSPPRNGRFLKLPDLGTAQTQHAYCSLMTDKQGQAKVLHNLRTALNSLTSSSSTTTIPRKIAPSSTTTTTTTRTPPPAVVLPEAKKSAPKKVVVKSRKPRNMYQLKWMQAFDDDVIVKYGLECLLAVCNALETCSDPLQCYQVLDNPQGPESNLLSSASNSNLATADQALLSRLTVCRKQWQQRIVAATRRANMHPVKFLQAVLDTIYPNVATLKIIALVPPPFSTTDTTTKVAGKKRKRSKSSTSSSTSPKKAPPPALEENTATLSFDEQSLAALSVSTSTTTTRTGRQSKPSPKLAEGA